MYYARANSSTLALVARLSLREGSGTPDRIRTCGLPLRRPRTLVADRVRSVFIGSGRPASWLIVANRVRLYRKHLQEFARS